LGYNRRLKRRKTMIIADDPFDLENTITDKTQPLSQKAYKKIRRKIISTELPPGAIIDEGALQLELGLGRTPIREALLRLSVEQLVLIVPRRGIFVTEISITDLNQLFEIRLELEALAIRQAVRRGTSIHWRQMEATLAQMPDEDNPNPHEILIAIDEQCHRIIYQAADNKFLQKTLVTLYALSLRLWFFFLAKIGGMQKTVDEHNDILEALRDGDEARAVHLMEEHIHAFQDEMVSAIMRDAAEA
jgi:DNA-binding GntR family transcriptional regulator